MTFSYQLRAPILHPSKVGGATGRSTSKRRSLFRMLARMTALLGLAAATGLCVSALVPASASAATGPVTFHNRFYTGACLDSNYHDPAASNPNQGAVYADPCNGGNYQNWNLVGDTIVDAQTEHCLDSDTHYGSSGNAYTLPCNGGDYQNWQITEDTWGYEIKDAQTGFCLTTSATPGKPVRVYTAPCTGSTYASWR